MKPIWIHVPGITIGDSVPVKDSLTNEVTKVLPPSLHVDRCCENPLPKLSEIMTCASRHSATLWCSSCGKYIGKLSWKG